MERSPTIGMIFFFFLFLHFWKALLCYFPLFLINVIRVVTCSILSGTPFHHTILSLHILAIRIGMRAYGKF